MSQNELLECQREVVLVHKRWKEAVSANDTQLATALDAAARELRHRIIAAKRGQDTAE